MMPAIDGADADVPPTSVTCSIPLEPTTQSPSWAQMGYALMFVPAAANSETSGRSRTRSLGTPVPLCQLGFAYPNFACPAPMPQTNGRPLPDVFTAESMQL